MPPFSRTIAPLRYVAEVRHLVLQLKFSARFDAGLSLALLLAEGLRACGELRVEWILPVPLHPRRLRARGFNQAQEIATLVSRSLDIGIIAGSVRRARYTTAQTELTGRRARVANVRGAFEVVARGAVAGRRIAIVDDVITTGATAASLATELLAAGALDVEIWACARAAAARP